MRVNVGAVKIALFLLFVFTLSTGAQVKLRIYLNDGSLQSGNLVTETKDGFVLLTSEGRVEIPKSKIMFVNGKTMMQWEEEGDKTYQTEILPKNVPKPSFVNEVPALPVEKIPLLEKRVDRAPSAQGGSPRAHGAAANGEEAHDMLLPGVPKPKDGKVEALPPPKEKEALSEAPKPTPAKRKSAKAARKPEPAPPVVKSANIPKPSAGTRRTREPQKPRPTREELGAFHYARAQDYLSSGQEGRAKQELHHVILFDRANAEAYFLLGKMYAEEGVAERARKLLEHPLLQKREDVRDILARMEKTREWNERRAWILAGSNIGGLFLGVLLVLIKRAVFRKKPAVHEIIADELDDPAKEIPKDDQVRLVMDQIKSLDVDKEPFPPAEEEGVVLGEKHFVGEPLPHQEPLMDEAFPVSESVSAPGLEVEEEEMPEKFIERKPEPIPPHEHKETAETKEPQSLEGIPPTPIVERQRPPEQLPLEVAKESPERLIEREKGAEQKSMPAPAPGPEQNSESEPQPETNPAPLAESKFEPDLEYKPEQPEESVPERKKYADDDQVNDRLKEWIRKQEESSSAKPRFELAPSHDSEREEVKSANSYGYDSTPPPHEREFQTLGNAQELLMKGHDLANQNRVAEASRCYKTALVLDPRSVDAYLGLAYLGFIQGSWEVAKIHYERALGLNPRSADALYGLGRVHLEFGEEEMAVHHFRRSLEMDPNFFEARDTLTALGKAA